MLLVMAFVTGCLQMGIVAGIYLLHVVLLDRVEHAAAIEIAHVLARVQLAQSHCVDLLAMEVNCVKLGRDSCISFHPIW